MGWDFGTSTALVWPCWRLLSNLDTLLYHAFKAKYFPDCGLLETVEGGRPFVYLESVYHAKQLLLQGTRWRLGMRCNIKVFKDPWIPNDRNFYVDFAPLSDMKDLRVKDTFFD